MNVDTTMCACIKVCQCPTSTKCVRTFNAQFGCLTRRFKCMRFTSLSKVQYIQRSRLASIPPRTAQVSQTLTKCVSLKGVSVHGWVVGEQCGGAGVLPLSRIAAFVYDSVCYSHFLAALTCVSNNCQNVEVRIAPNTDADAEAEADTDADADADADAETDRDFNKDQDRDQDIDRDTNRDTNRDTFTRFAQIRRHTNAPGIRLPAGSKFRFFHNASKTKPTS